MSILSKICVVHDVAARSYGVPMVYETEEMCRREFVSFLAQNQIFFHGDDYEACIIGEYCNRSGKIYSFDEPVILRFSDVKEAVDLLRDRVRAEALKRGAAVGGNPPQAASSDR